MHVQSGMTYWVAMMRIGVARKPRQEIKHTTGRGIGVYAFQCHYVNVIATDDGRCMVAETFG